MSDFTSSATATIYVNGKPAKDVIANLKKDIVDYRNQLHEIATDPSLGVNSQKWKEVQKNVFVSLAT